MKRISTNLIFSLTLFLFLFTFFFPLPTFANIFGGGGTDISSLNKYAQNVLNALVYISGPLAVAAVIYGGIMYMLSAGDEKKAQTAKRIIMFALIGVTVIVGSYFLISLTTTFFS